VEVADTTPVVINGISEFQVTKWDAFGLGVEFFAKDLGFIFRGQQVSDWKLETSLDRLHSKLDQRIDVNSTYDYLLGNFAKSIRGRTEISKDIVENKDELWALGQHYGLATPLLDWTYSIYVSVFFAFENPEPSPTGFRTIWALHRSGVEKALKGHNEASDYNNQIGFIEPMSDHNPRLVSQSGLFSKQPVGFLFEDWIRSTFKGETERPYLFKIHLPDSERMTILKHLRQMNIHHGTLFPDLIGASKYCNDTLEIMDSKSITMSLNELKS
jgi:hypothetical protein